MAKLLRPTVHTKKVNLLTCGLLAYVMPSLGLAQSNGHEDEFYGVLGDLFIVGGQVLLVAVTSIAFIWISYLTVAKFRDCQKGQADWAELIVLGVGAAMLLVFVSILLAGAGDFLLPE